MKFCVIVPVYNEEKELPALIVELKKSGTLAFFVDDGSNDESQRLIEESGFPFAKHQKNQGKGSALKTGMDWAFSQDFDAVITLDGDGQHPINQISEFVKLAQNKDFVIGNRINRVGKMPIHRRLSNRLVSWLVSLRVGKHIPDAQCGMRLIKRKVWENIAINNNGYFSEIELVIKVVLQKYSVGIIDIPAIYNGCNSSIRPVREIVVFLFGYLRSFAW
ncbi:MAG: glycosyltransferase family 2 protein [Candidatus Marinimicrobia bacterium]|nr:glycosyltransferase family 2 protein [Candidatus Neomarinimicrobiota bacterium]